MQSGLELKTQFIFFIKSMSSSWVVQTSNRHDFCLLWPGHLILFCSHLTKFFYLFKINFMINYNISYNQIFFNKDMFVIPLHTHYLADFCEKNLDWLWRTHLLHKIKVMTIVLFTIFKCGEHNNLIKNVKIILYFARYLQESRKFYKINITC